MSLFGEKSTITTCYVYIALSCCFSGEFFCFSLAWIEIVVLKKHHYKRRVDCKKHDRKKQRSVDCAEATKKTVQAMRNEWWGFFMAGDIALRS